MNDLMRGLIAASTLGLLGSGCGAQDYPYDGDLDGGGAANECWGDSESFPLDEDTPLGFSGQDVLDAFESDMHVTLTWADETTSELTISITIEADFDGGNASYFVPMDTFDGCGERVDVPVRLTLSTDDGRLDGETFQGYLEAPNHDDGEFRADRYAETISGSADWASLADPGSYDPEIAVVFLSADLAPNGGSGQLSLQTHDEGSGASFNDVVASW